MFYHEAFLGDFIRILHENYVKIFENSLVNWQVYSTLQQYKVQVTTLYHGH